MSWDSQRRMARSGGIKYSKIAGRWAKLPNTPEDDTQSRERSFQRWLLEPTHGEPWSAFGLTIRDIRCRAFEESAGQFTPQFRNHKVFTGIRAASMFGFGQRVIQEREWCNHLEGETSRSSNGMTLVMSRLGSVCNHMYQPRKSGCEPSTRPTRM